jgi:hypothetical protein
VCSTWLQFEFEVSLTSYDASPTTYLGLGYKPPMVSSSPPLVNELSGHLVSSCGYQGFRVHDDALLMASFYCYWILFCWSGMIIPGQLLSKQDVYIVFTLLANRSFSSKHLSYISVMCR